MGGEGAGRRAPVPSGAQVPPGADRPGGRHLLAGAHRLLPAALVAGRPRHRRARLRRGRRRAAAGPQAPGRRPAGGRHAQQRPDPGAPVAVPRPAHPAGDPRPDRERSAPGPRRRTASPGTPRPRSARCTGPTRPTCSSSRSALRITNSRRENLRKELLRGVEVRRMLDHGLAKADPRRAPRLRDPRRPGLAGRRDRRDRPGRHAPRQPVRPHGPGLLRRRLLRPRIRPLPQRPPAGEPAGRRHRRLGRPDEHAARGRRPDLVHPLPGGRRAARSCGWTPSTASPWRRTSRTRWSCSTPTDCPKAAATATTRATTSGSRPSDTWRPSPPIPALASDTVAADAVVDERLAYYVGVNNLIGMVGALGATALVDERLLLRRAREVLARFAASRQALGRPHRATEALLESATLPCKANLLTRVAGWTSWSGRWRRRASTSRSRTRWRCPDDRPPDPQRLADPHLRRHVRARPPAAAARAGDAPRAG